jgi:hypothetical protein
MKPIAYHGLLRAAVFMAVPIGAVGSIGFMLRVGQRNESRMLLAMFTVWVLSPFLALAWAQAKSRRWPASAQSLLSGVTLLVAFGSLLIYGIVALGPPRPQPAFWFLMLPLASWLLLVAVIVAGLKRKQETT